MDSSMVKGVVMGSAIALAAGAAGITGYKAMTKPDFAEVLAVKEIEESVKMPREECADVRVSRRAPVQDQNRIAGTVTGGLLGGLLGNQVGSGRGRTVATVAGVAAGGYAGNRVQQNMQESDTTTRIERRCRTVNVTSKQIIGYDVTYRLDGKQDLIRMAFNPGKQIPVKDGQLVLQEPANSR